MDGCTVGCGGGWSSTPCDRHTRDERRRTHELFDPLWYGAAPAFASRYGAYEWLQHAMQLSEQECHIGRFDREQCLRAQAKIHELLERRAETQRRRYRQQRRSAS